MSIFIPTNTGTKRESPEQIEFRRQLDAIVSWPVRAQKVEDRLQETARALAARDEQLFALRGDFDALIMDFWNAFARSLGCENPSETIARQQAWQRQQEAPQNAQEARTPRPTPAADTKRLPRTRWSSSRA